MLIVKRFPPGATRARTGVIPRAENSACGFVNLNEPLNPSQVVLSQALPGLKEAIVAALQSPAAQPLYQLQKRLGEDGAEIKVTLNQGKPTTLTAFLYGEGKDSEHVVKIPLP